MFGARIVGRGAQRIIDAMVRWLAYGHINPNILTFVGVAINVASGLLFGLGQFFWAGIVLIVANLFDMLDGQVARRGKDFCPGFEIQCRYGAFGADAVAVDHAPFERVRAAEHPAYFRNATGFDTGPDQSIYRIEVRRDVEHLEALWSQHL